MLSIKIEDDYWMPQDWHVGDGPIMGIFVPGNALERVVMVQVDGHELEAVKDQLRYLPGSYTGRVVRWYGDHARFIIGNLE